jgi:predicted DNA binding CopG/RHH family protein
MRFTKAKKVPNFQNEDEERAFWANHSPLDYFDVSKAQKAIFPNLKPTLKSISIRLPIDLLENLKVLANKQDVPYQSLAKIYLGRQILLEKHPVRSLHRSYSYRHKAKTALKTK